MTDSEVIVPMVKQNKICMIDLKRKKANSLPHLFMTDVSVQVEIDAFLQTKLICIRENGGSKNNTFRLTYYHYPLPHSYPKDNKHKASVFEA